MKIKSNFLAFGAFYFMFALSMFGQSSSQLDSKSTTFIDNAVMECIYKYNINAPLMKSQTDEKQLLTYTTILQTSSSVSKFWDWNTFKKDSIIYFSSTQLTTDSVKNIMFKYNIKVKNLFTPVIVKNYPNGKITVEDELIIDDYTYQETKVERSWRLMDDTLTVCGYLCNKAVTSFGGREWIAWYAPDITLSDGPWKLYGLPGLILKAKDVSGVHSFEAIAIRQSKYPIYLTKNFMQINTNKDRFIKSKNKFEENPQLNIPSGLINSVTILKKEGLKIINGKHFPMDSKTIYCPLELK